jgi:IrrE N-terminal-like domain
MVSKRRNNERKWRGAAARAVVQYSGTDRPPEEAVGSIASDLLKNIKHPPTDLWALAQRLGVGDIVADDIPFSGELRKEGPVLILRYGSHLSQGRKRFTIAHELGHAILLRAGLSLPHRGAEVERLCDMFGSALLMPSEVFLKLAQPISLSRVFQLARQFDVSLAAAAVRCANLLNVSLFQIAGDRIQWGYGKYRSGPLSSLHPKLGFLDGKERVAGERFTLIDAVLWRVEWAPTEKNESVMVLLSPKSQEPSNKTTRVFASRHSRAATGTFTPCSKF